MSKSVDSDLNAVLNASRVAVADFIAAAERSAAV